MLYNCICKQENAIYKILYTCITVLHILFIIFSEGISYAVHILCNRIKSAKFILAYRIMYVNGLICITSNVLSIL